MCKRNKEPNYGYEVDLIIMQKNTGTLTEPEDPPNVKEHMEQKQVLLFLHIKYATGLENNGNYSIMSSDKTNNPDPI